MFPFISCDCAKLSYLIYRYYHMTFVTTDLFSAQMSWYISKRTCMLEVWYQNKGVMRDLLWQIVCHDLFVIYLAQGNISESWRTTICYQLQKRIWYILESCDMHVHVFFSISVRQGKLENMHNALHLILTFISRYQTSSIQVLLLIYQDIWAENRSVVTKVMW
jgi:hypothetical protein